MNSVIGSGVFGLPSSVAGLVGEWSPLAVILAGACIFAIVLAFCEVGSRFDQAGGPYLYTRQSFGHAVGFQIGWLHVWTRIVSGAAVLNVLVSYLAVLAPSVGAPLGRAVVMTVCLGLVTAVNVAGVKQSAWMVNLFTVAKLLPLALLVALGLFQLDADTLATQRVAERKWTDAVLLLVFAYGGFESSVVAAGESRDPKRDTAFALIVGMLVVTVVYCAVQLAVVGVLPNASTEAAPVSAALGVVLGGGGRTVGTVAVVLSVYGWLSGFALMTPRILYAMAQRGELPSSFGRVHASRRTPHVAIITNSAIVLLLAIAGGFAQLAVVGAITRLAIFALTCAALIKLRRTDGPAPFTLAGGPLFAMVGIAFCIWMITTRSLAQAWPLGVIVALGFIAWLAAQRRTERVE